MRPLLHIQGTKELGRLRAGLGRRIRLACMVALLSAPVGALLAQTVATPQTLLDRTLSMIDAHLDGVRSMTRRLPMDGVTGAMMAYDPAEDVAGAADGGRYGKGDRAWVETALSVYDLYRLLGGEVPPDRQLFARQDSRFFVGNERGAGAWFDTPDAALAHYFGLLARASRQIAPGAQPAGTPTDLTSLSRRLSAGLASASATSGATLLPVGTRMRISMEGVETVVGEPGLEITETADGTMVSADGTADGRLRVHGYAAGRRFGPAETMTVTVPSTATQPTPNETNTALSDGGTLVPGGRTEGRLVRGGGGNRYTLTLGGGPTTITSDGTADVTAKLVDAQGTEVARDDDGGEGYNFLLEADLPAGTYSLVIEHCCLGGGRYGVSVSGGN